MSTVDLSRFQFAMTSIYHFLFVPVTIGLAVLTAVLHTAWYRSRDDGYLRLTRFFGTLLIINIAVGVVTGLVQEFQFGMNWADYSRFVGNVFGSLLAAEGVFAFFLEGGFLGLMLFGGNRLGPRLWLFSIFMVVFGAHFSALWILMANSWMQTPQGYEVVDNRAVMTDFWQVVFTPTFIPRLLHVWAASWTVGAALMCSVSAWYLLKKQHIELAKSNLKAALPVFILFAILNVIVFGANMAVAVTDNQPLKLASMEGLYQSESCARMYVVGWVDTATQTTSGISIPCLLSFLAYQDIHATVQGIDSFAPAPTPPINLLFQVYHFMITMGPALAGIGVLAGIMFLWKRRLYESRFVLWLLVLTVFIGEATITAGWWTGEIGRQPWVVYNVLTTADGHSPVLTAVDVALSLGMFLILYSLLLVLFLYLLNRKIHDGPEELEDVETVPMSSLPDTFRDVFSRSRRAADLGDEP